MRLRYILVFIAQIAVADVSAQDAEDAGPDAGATLTHPGAGEKNKRLIDTYTDDHGCSCSTLGRTHAPRGWVAGLAFAGAVGARAWRRRQQGITRA